MMEYDLPGILIEFLYSSMAFRKRLTCRGFDVIPTKSTISLNSISLASTS